MPLKTSIYKKTKDGYLIELEDRLNIPLPLVYWRLKIDRAFLLADTLKKNDIAYFFYLCGSWGLPFISKQLTFNEDQNEKKIE